MLQGVPPLLVETAWLRLQLVAAWQTRLNSTACGVGAPHYAEVTRCFLVVSQDSNLGGVARSEVTEETSEFFNCIWMGAVLTSMMFVCQHSLRWSIATAFACTGGILQQDASYL